MLTADEAKTISELRMVERRILDVLSHPRCIANDQRVAYTRTVLAPATIRALEQKGYRVRLNSDGPYGTHDVSWNH